MENLYKQYKEFKEKQSALGYAMQKISWDAQTEAPKKSSEYRAKMVGLLTREATLLAKDEKFVNIVNELFDNLDKLNDFQQREITEEKRNLDRTLKIPIELQVEYSKQRSLSEQKWIESRAKSDYSIFKPSLEVLVKLINEINEYIKEDGQELYNILLDNFERDMTMEKYNKFFNQLKEELVPFVLEVLDKETKYVEDFMKHKFSKEKQKEFVEYLIEVLNFDLDRGVLKESVHPFTAMSNPDDVRFTVRYLEDFFFSSIFAGAHEMGHAIYNQGQDTKYDGTTLSGGASLGIHESQSRFYENIIARSKAFWETHYNKLQEVFKEELKDVSLDDFYKVANKVQRSYIRVEADELTYPLHIMVRYEIEQGIFNGTISLDELPQVWNEKFKEYLGITPPNDALGVLQDVHWSFGLFGYFPTYALGTAISSQIANTMEKELNIDECIRNNDIKKINAWLKENIHQHAGYYKPMELLKKVTGEELNPSYYINYLKEKYSKLI